MTTDMLLKGDRKLQRKMRRMAERDVKAAIRKGSRAGTKITTRKAKQEAPVDSGAMRKGIKTKSLKRSRTRIGTKTVVGGGWHKGSLFYAAFIEFGHRVGKKSLGDKRTKVKPNDFMARAHKLTETRAKRKAITTMKRELLARAKR
jgi:HK97 gp10 family phage protein